jgi:hypothetical protein
VDLDPEIFAKGLGDALSDSKTLMTRDQAQATIARLQDSLKRTEMDRARMQAPQTSAPGQPHPEQDRTKQ